MTTGSGQDGFSFVDGAACTFPVVIDGTHNQFAFNSTQFIIPSGTYANAKALAHAVNQATGISAVLSVTASSAVAGALRFTSKLAGVHAEAFAAGSSNDCLSGKLGITAAWLINRTQAATAITGAHSQQGTVYSSSVFWDGTRYSGNPAQVGEDNV